MIVSIVWCGVGVLVDALVVPVCVCVWLVVEAVFAFGFGQNKRRKGNEWLTREILPTLDHHKKESTTWKRMHSQERD